MTFTRRQLHQLSISELAHRHIDAALQKFDEDAPGPKAKLNDRIVHLLKMYESLRPLLTAASGLALLPLRWRVSLTLFLRGLDDLAAATPSFKMGKDL